MAGPEDRSSWDIEHRNHAKRYFETLVRRSDSALIQQIEAELVANPFYDSLSPRARRHLKGAFDCKREYRRLPNNERIVYEVDTKRRVITLLRGGPHDRALST